jgi:hypothetical protein
MTVIPAMWEAETGKAVVPGQPGKRLTRPPPHLNQQAKRGGAHLSSQPCRIEGLRQEENSGLYLKNNKRAGSVAQVVEHLPRKHVELKPQHHQKKKHH